MKTDSLLEDANNGSSQENTVGEKHSTILALDFWNSYNISLTELKNTK